MNRTIHSSKSRSSHSRALFPLGTGTARLPIVGALTGALLLLTGCTTRDPLPNGEGGSGGSGSSTGGSGGTASSGGGGSGGTGVSAPATVQELFKMIGPMPRSFEIDAMSGGVIMGDAVMLEIPESSILDKTGDPLDTDTDGDGKPDAHLVTGPVEISLREFRSVGDMVRGGRPTIMAGGFLLETSGSFEIEASQKGKPLVVRELRNVVFPKWPGGTSDGMELWLAGPTDEFWARPKMDPSGEVMPVPAIDQGKTFQFDTVPMAMANSVNCDGAKPMKEDSTIFDIVPTQPDVEGGEIGPLDSKNTAVFLLPDGENSAGKLYQTNKALTGFTSPEGTLPAGLKGKLVVLSLRAGKYYLYRDEAFTIPSKPGATVPVELQEMSEADFMAYMNSL